MKSSRGNARATFLSRGIPLPKRGSVAERVMFEILQRERATEATKWEISMMVIGTYMGVKTEAATPIITSMKRQLEKRLNGKAYFARFVRDALIAKKEELNRDQDLLDRLAKMGDEDK